MHNDLTSSWIDEYCASKERTEDMDMVVESCQIFKEIFKSDHFYPEPFVYPKTNAKKEKRIWGKLRASYISRCPEKNNREERLRKLILKKKALTYDKN